MTKQSKLGQALGDGPAKSGTGHWKAQRISAIALIPLLLWFVISFIVILPAPYYMASAWLKSPFTVTMMILLAVTMFYHGYLGMQVIIEDYIHHEGLKTTFIILTQFASVFMGLLAIISCLVVMLG